MASRRDTVGQVFGIEFTKESGLPGAAQPEMQNRSRQGGDPLSSTSTLSFASDLLS